MRSGAQTSRRVRSEGTGRSESSELRESDLRAISRRIPDVQRQRQCEQTLEQADEENERFFRVKFGIFARRALDTNSGSTKRETRGDNRETWTNVTLFTID